MYAQKRGRLSSANKPQRQHVPDLNDLKLFPATIPGRQHGGQSAPKKNATFAETVRYVPSSMAPNINVNSFAQFGKKQKNEEPFSPEELMNLTSDIFTQLRNVQTASREDVLMAVMRLSLKYLYKNND